MANKYESGSKVRVNRMCWRKLRYKTADAAAPVGTMRRAYLFPECGKWHRTSKPIRQPKT